LRSPNGIKKSEETGFNSWQVVGGVLFPLASGLSLVQTYPAYEMVALNNILTTTTTNKTQDLRFSRQ
jgi:hypothetical protein